MPHAYTEDHLVAQPAIGLFAEFGWQVVEPLPTVALAGQLRDTGLPGRETTGQEVLRYPSHFFSGSQKCPLALVHTYHHSSQGGFQSLINTSASASGPSPTSCAATTCRTNSLLDP